MTRKQYFTFRRILSRACYHYYVKGDTYRACVLVTRLWNHVDHMMAPEPLWNELASCCGFAFRDSANPQSIVFTYAGELS